MQAQVKYKSEVKTAVLGDHCDYRQNLTPVFSPQEQDKQSREVERRLFDVFRKYTGQYGGRRNIPCCKGATSIIYL